jgi:hypothetical protein
MISEGLSRRGLSLVTTIWSARSHAARPMRGRLALSLSPPAPKTTQRRPALAFVRVRAHHAAHGLERLPESIVGVGVVDEHGGPVRLMVVGADALQPAAGRGGGAHRGGDAFGRETDGGVERGGDRAARGEGLEHVHRVVVADQRGADRDLAPGADQVHEGAGDGSIAHQDGAPAGGSLAIGEWSRDASEHGCAAVADHPCVRRILGVDNGVPLRGKRVEEACLGVGVRLHRLVVVEVVTGQVGEDADGVSHGGDAPLVERVARGLHGARGAPELDHRRQRAADLDGGGRGHARGCDLAAVVDQDGADHPRADGAGVQRLVDQVDDRGLAVGARDADHFEARRGVAVETLGHDGGDAGDIGGDDEGDALVDVSMLGAALADTPGADLGIIGDDGDGTLLAGLADVGAPVGVGAAPGDEEGAGHDGAAVLGDVADAHGRGIAPDDARSCPGDEFG